jgi:hypothetical protein
VIACHYQQMTKNKTKLLGKNYSRVGGMEEKNSVEKL